MSIPKSPEELQKELDIRMKKFLDKGGKGDFMKVHNVVMKEGALVNKGDLLFNIDDRELKIEVKIENETVWLTQANIAELFGVKRPAITIYQYFVKI